MFDTSEIPSVAARLLFSFLCFLLVSLSLALVLKNIFHDDDDGIFKGRKERKQVL